MTAESFEMLAKKLKSVEEKLDAIIVERNAIIEQIATAVKSMKKDSLVKLPNQPQVRTGGRRNDFTKSILSVFEDNKPMSTADIKAKLEGKGIDPTGLSNMLSRLAKAGEIKRHSRSVYKREPLRQ